MDILEYTIKYKSSMGVLVYNGKYQLMAKAPLDLAALKDYYHSVYYDSSGLMKIGEEDNTLLETLRAGMKSKK